VEVICSLTGVQSYCNCDYVLYDFNETCYISLGSYQKEIQNSYWVFEKAKLYAAPKDTKEPALLDVAPMASTTFNKGDKLSSH